MARSVIHRFNCYRYDETRKKLIGLEFADVEADILAASPDAMTYRVDITFPV